MAGLLSGLANTRAGRVLAAGLLLVTAAVMSAFVVVFTLHRVGMDLGGLKQAVDIGGENNLPTWWNGLLLLGVAVAAAGAATRAGRATERRAWWVIAGAAGYLTLDELAQLHERLNGPVRATGLDLPTYAWLVPGVVMAAGGAAILVAAGRRLPRLIARRLALALVVYLAGALGMEAVNGLVSPRGLGLDLVFAAGTTIEESLEMLACVLALTAIVDHLARRPARTLRIPGPREGTERIPASGPSEFRAAGRR